MITTKLHSPFLVLYMLILLTGSCGESKKTLAKNDVALKIERLLTSASDSEFSSNERIDNATKAYDNAVLLDSTYLIWKGFSIKYPLLQEKDSAGSVLFLNDYRHLATKKKDTLNLAVALFETGKKFAALQKSDSAYFYYNASRILCEARHDSLGVVEKLTNMAYMHFTYNDFVEFENVTTAGLKFLPKVPRTNLDSVYLSYAYNNYGLAYSNLFEPENALQYYRNALILNKDKAFSNSISNNIGLLLLSNDRFSEAVRELSELALLKEVKSDTTLYAQVADNLGYSLFKLKDPAAFRYMTEAHNLRELSNDHFGSVASNIHLAEYYKKSNPQLSEKYAVTAYNKATKLRSTDDRLAALKLLSDTGTAGNKSTFSKYISLKDSIDKVRQKARNQFAKIKYDSKTANDENLKLKIEKKLRALQIERGRWINFGLISALLIFLVIARLLFLLYRKRHKKEKILEVYNTEMRISKKVHDELANDVFNTITFAQTQNLSDLPGKELLMEKLESIYDRARDVSRENSPIDTGANYPLQLRQMLAEYQSNNIRIMIKGLDSLPWETMEADKKQTLYRVLQELMVNMKKHSHAKNVVLQFTMEGNKAKITYNDNGIGMDVASLFLKNGLQNVENRINAIGGHIIFDSKPGKGLQSTIIYPP